MALLTKDIFLRGERRLIEQGKKPLDQHGLDYYFGLLRFKRVSSQDFKDVIIQMNSEQIDYYNDASFDKVLERCQELMRDRDHIKAVENDRQYMAELNKPKCSKEYNIERVQEILKTVFK